MAESPSRAHADGWTITGRGGTMVELTLEVAGVVDLRRRCDG